MKKQRGSINKNILVLIFTLVIMILISELVLRALVLTPEEVIEKQRLKTTIIYNNSDTYFAKVNNPKLVYTLKPDMEFRYNVYSPDGLNYTFEVKTNSEGFRDRNFTVIKPKNMFRIIVLGDSIAFGESQNLNQTFSKYLEDELNNSSMNVEVINMAVTGYTTTQEVELLKQKGLRYSPDLVILSFALNDPHEPTDIFEQQPKSSVSKSECKIDMLQLKIPCFVENLFKKSYILYSSKELIRKMISSYSTKKESEVYTNYFDSYFKNESNFAYVSSAFENLKNISQKNDFSVLVVITPIFYDLKYYEWSYAHAMVKEEAEENNFYCLDLYQVYKNFDPQEVKNPAKYDFLHLNPKGHSIAAEEIYRFMLENRFIGNETS